LYAGRTEAPNSHHAGVRSEEMARRGRIGACITHSWHDARELTSPARAAFLSTFEKQVDLDGVHSPDERRRRATLARKSHMVCLARLSVLARRGASDAIA
jgi:hypothetical protein